MKKKSKPTDVVVHEGIPVEAEEIKQRRFAAVESHVQFIPDPEKLLQQVATMLKAKSTTLPSDEFEKLCSEYGTTPEFITNNTIDEIVTKSMPA